MRGVGICLLLLLGGALKGASQALPAAGPGGAAPVPAWQATFFGAPEVARPRLLAAAVAHSYDLAVLKTDQDVATQDLKIARKSILSAVQVVNSVGYGNIATVTVADQAVVGTGSGTSTSQTRYSTGLALNLSLDRLASRGNLLNRQKLLVRKTEQVAQAREALLRRQVLELYETVRLDYKILGYRQQAYLTAQLNYQLAEKQFKAGELELSILSQLNATYINAMSDQATASSSYTTAFVTLEELLGCSLAELLAPADAPTPTTPIK